MRTPEKVAYRTKVVSTGSRRGGRSTSEDGLLDVELEMPEELGGPGGRTNPEQLFGAGFAACFTSALGLVAKDDGVDASNARVTAEVGFGPEGESFGITVDLTVEVPGLDTAKVQELADAAHQVCPYSKATRGNIPVTVTAA
ncbi:MAG: Ohr family peroxiredoxin [Streptosporangiales bacterium]|nr:Ohr family peroxiredoxin [Streptosporangiales bacterium]